MVNNIIEWERGYGQAQGRDARRKKKAAVAQAMRSGSVQKLDESLERLQWHFIQAGTYLVLEKLKQAVLRRLLKRVHCIHAQSNPEKSSQLPLGESARWHVGTLSCCRVAVLEVVVGSSIFMHRGSGKYGSRLQISQCCRCASHDRWKRF